MTDPMAETAPTLHCETVELPVKKPRGNIANLTPWKSGQSGNPAGRKPAGLSYIEHVNTLATLPLSDVQRVGNDPSEAVIRRAAALDLADLVTKRRSIPLERILDRTHGKAVQTLAVKQQSLEDMEAESHRIMVMMGLSRALPPAPEPLAVLELGDAERTA